MEVKMKKAGIVILLVASLGASLPVQAATHPIQVVYNEVPMEMSQEPIVRHGKVWLPIRAIAENMGCVIRYESKEKMVYLSGKNIGEMGFEVVQAGSTSDDGYSPILLNQTVYLPIRDIANYLKKDVKWDSTTKKVTISSIVEMDAMHEETPVGELRYNTETGDFYNGKMLIANLPFKRLDSFGADKQKTPNNHVLYTVWNSSGEPHINDELYAVYTVNGGLHIAKSFKWNANGSNSLIQDHKVVLIDQNVLSVYDDTTGALIKRHTISTKPLKAYLEANYDAEYAKEIFEEASIGYLVEAVGEDFVLYRNYALGTLTLVNLKDDTEVELYKEVYPEGEVAALENGIREDGDYLQFVKAENGVLYLKHIWTEDIYQYALN